MQRVKPCKTLWLSTEPIQDSTLSLLAATFTSCWEPLQTVCIQIRTDRLSVLIWIQTVWHSDSVPESFLEKWIFQKETYRRQKSKHYQACKELIVNKLYKSCFLLINNLHIVSQPRYFHLKFRLGNHWNTHMQLIRLYVWIFIQLLITIRTGLYNCLFLLHFHTG